MDARSHAHQLYRERFAGFCPAKTSPAALKRTCGMRFVTAVLGALVCFGLSGASFAASNPFPRDGFLAFSCGGCPGAEAGSSLFTIRTNGRELRLVRNGAAALGPRWGPDGRTLAVSRGSQEIWLTRADGRNWRRLTKPPGRNQAVRDTSPSWFPDGERLVFVRETSANGRTGLWSVGVPRRGARLVLASPVSADLSDATNVIDPEPSHDGRWIAFGDISGHLWTARADGRGRRRLGPTNLTGSGPRWSPEDRRVAFLDFHADALRILDLRTNRVRTIIGGDATDAYSWSPDGRWLAVALSREIEGCGSWDGPCYDLEIWIVNAADGRSRRIFSASFGEIYGLDWRRTQP